MDNPKAVTHNLSSITCITVTQLYTVSTLTTTIFMFTKINRPEKGGISYKKKIDKVEILKIFFTLNLFNFGLDKGSIILCK
ncbi:hypothetical protein OMAG_000114 [Candidatus Omnitrophus magneticus]|uniref:Uncharacterized protein n=1 Tax=Candidatus Omnitrophus magneticus TaxID=1609969 RepID=A0A0F0CX44_9BACT|nr:hypothetical protein OMAG_000114 [Candidatus Omnitrophus magneticus]